MVTVLSIMNFNALAQDKTDLESVDVWSTEVTSSSLNLGENAIETKQANHLSDLLRDLPGVDVGGTHSINNRINIRGLQDENLEISLDGAKVQNANMFHHIGNLLINPDILKKADIQVGTNSVVNGSLGGAVSFETKDGVDMLEDGRDFGARVQTNYSSNDSYGGSITAYGKILEDADFLIYHNYLNKNDWKDGNGTETFGTEGDVNNTLIKLGYNLTDSQRISISYDRYKDEGDYAPRPDFGRDYNEARTGLDTFDTEYTRETITLNHELDLGDPLYLKTTLYTNENELERYEGPLTSGANVRPGGLSEGLLNGKVKTKGINAKAQSRFNTSDISHTLTYGGLYDVQSSKVEWNGEKYGENEEAKYGALYLENRIDFTNGLSVTPGIRYNHYDFDGVYSKDTNSEFTYGLATEYAINNNWTLIASATTLYKGVEMVDVLATNRIYAPESKVDPETGINKEIGFRYETTDTLGADYVGVSFKYFQTDIDDYIQIKEGTNYEMENGGTLELDGVEVSLAYQKGNFDALLTYAHTDTNFEDSGEPLEKEPGDSFSLGLDYKIMPNLSVSWDSLVVLDQNDVPEGAYLEKESYDVHDIAVNWKPKAVKGLTVIAGIDNIFDEAYYSHISENRLLTVAGEDHVSTDYEPGRNFKVTLAYKF